MANRFGKFKVKDSPAREGREPATGQSHTGSGNNNVEAITFFVFWLPMIGYAGKAVWDEAPDRVVDIFDRAIDHLPAWTGQHLPLKSAHYDD